MLGAGNVEVAFPLFQAGSGGSSPTPALQFQISKITYSQAARFIEKWHYSARMPTGKNICFGLWYGDTIYAVIVYGIGINPYQARFLQVDSVLEIKRLARSEPRLKYPLSRFIAITSRFVFREFHCDCIVAFADPEHGHRGTVYKASGFEFNGVTNAEWHTIDSNGIKRHRRYAFRHARRNGTTIEESREQLGLSRIQTAPKYRWVKYAKRRKPNANPIQH